MQAYRRAYEVDGKKGRLSQEGLLRLMGQVDPIYLERYNHSTVARWESGSTRPTRERLDAFGRALDLSVAEIQGMMWLAGLHEDDETTQPPQTVGQLTAGTAGDVLDVIASQDAVAANSSTGVSYANQVTRYILTKFALPGLTVSALGYILALLGWNAGWLMSLYVIFAVFLVMVQGFLRMRRSHELREIYFITVFFLLSGSLLQAPAIRMDPYGFYSVGDFANTPIPYLLAAMVNIFLALIAGLMFDFLWRWQYSSGRGFKNSCHRAAWTTFPPLLFVYIFALIFCCQGTWIFLLLVFSIMGAAFMSILVMRDNEMSFRGWEKRLMMQAAFGVILVLTALGGASILILYLDPSPLAIPDHNLLRSWLIDFDALGYSPDELLERYRIAAALSSMFTFIYMVLVLGGSVLVTIYRLDIEDPPVPAGEPEGSAESIVAGQTEKNLTSATLVDGALDPRVWLQSGRESLWPTKQSGD